MTTPLDQGALWTLADAVALCAKLEKIAPHYGAHVALTGGTLYKDGPRKDCDILFYRIRQVREIDVDGLMHAIRDIGVEPARDYGWCYKATYQDRPIDFFFPEREGDNRQDYPPTQDAPSLAISKAADEEEIAF